MDTRGKIITSAIKVFAVKGKHGARMEEIAADAGINKAMLYYYYSTKNNLYKEVLAQIVKDHGCFIHERMKEAMSSSTDPLKILRVFAGVHLEAFMKDENRTKVIIEALSSQPKDMAEAVRMKVCEKGAPVMFDVIREGIKKKLFRDIDPRQLLISIVGMNMIYLAAKPMAEALLDFRDEREQQSFLKSREHSIIDLVLNGILLRKGQSCAH